MDSRYLAARLRKLLLWKQGSDVNRQFDGGHERGRGRNGRCRLPLQDCKRGELGQLRGDENRLSRHRLRHQRKPFRQGISRHDRRSLGVCEVVSARYRALLRCRRLLKEITLVNPAPAGESSRYRLFLPTHVPQPHHEAASGDRSAERTCRDKF